MPDNDPGWPAYLQAFHESRPGCVGAVLSRTVAGDHTPYRWLCRAVSGEARRVLDLACGSGPVARELAAQHRPAPWVVGADVSAAELVLSPRPVVRADALRLPFADEVFDVVTCSMGLMVLRPLPEALAEAARVLRPGGVLVATVPTVRPLRGGDLPVLTSLTARLRSTPRFPAGGEIAELPAQLRAAGFDLLESQRERYAFGVRSLDDARLLVRSLYLPDTTDARRDAAAEWLAERARARGEIEIAVPVRRLVAMRSGRA